MTSPHPPIQATRPDDVSQEAWEAGQEALMQSRLFMIATDDFDEHSAIIARAIMAAKAEEREACELVCVARMARHQKSANSYSDEADRVSCLSDALEASQCVTVIRNREA